MYLYFYGSVPWGLTIPNLTIPNQLDQSQYEKLRKAEEDTKNADKRAERINAKRQELASENERLAHRCQVFEKELNDQLSVSGNLRKEVGWALVLFEKPQCDLRQAM